MRCEYKKTVTWRREGWRAKAFRFGCLALVTLHSPGKVLVSTSPRKSNAQNQRLNGIHESLSITAPLLKYVRIWTLPVSCPLLHVSSSRSSTAHSSGTSTWHEPSSIPTSAHTTTTHHSCRKKANFNLKCLEMQFSVASKIAMKQRTSSSHHATSVSSHWHASTHHSHHGLASGHGHF